MCVSRVVAQLGLRLAASASALPKAGAVIVDSLGAAFGKISSSRDERSPPRWRAFSHVAACALAIGGGDLPRLARGDVLYDSTAMTDDGTWNTTFTTYIGGTLFFGHDIDVQAADDFILGETYIITSVTADYGSAPGQGSPPASGVLVEFFTQLDDCSYDGGPCPSETPSAAVLSTAVTATSLDGGPGEPDFRITVDLSSDDITLDSGTWWVSITPFDDTGRGAVFFQIASTAGTFGNNTHLRNGGLDHGNGLPGLFGVDDWTLAGLSGNQEDADLAMKIEGTPVKLACPADLDGDGSVGASDLLALLAAWGPNPDHPADLDGDGSVGASDLLALLANWGPCR